MALNLSVCVEMIFNNLPFEDRIKAVAAAGYKAFEFWGWSNKDMPAVAKAAEEAGLTIASFCVEYQGSLVDPNNRDNFVAGARASIEQAVKYGVKTLIVTTGNEIPDVSRWAQHDAILTGLQAAAPYAEEKGVTLVLEPLNILVDHKGYYLTSSQEGFDIVRAVGSPNIKLLYDIYHQQITEGFLIPTIKANISLVGHFHCADVPGRHEPGTGEINYANVFRVIAESDYQGYVGLEFVPTTTPEDALARVKKIAGLGCGCC
ncbi:MAG: TIM barrel protein [Armatimonadetes bacterium]|nr:TIM barrel protein [Armatimonadota bacterium]